MESRAGKQILYMAVTPDEYELPLFVTPYILEMAEHTGMDADNIHTYISKGHPGTKKGYKFLSVKVEVD